MVFTRTQSSGALALYVDGAAAGTATGTTNTLNSQATLFFGQQSGGIQRYAGSLDEISVYNSVLSGATVSAHCAYRATGVRLAKTSFSVFQGRPPFLGVGRDLLRQTVQVSAAPCDTVDRRRFRIARGRRTPGGLVDDPDG